MAEKTQDPREPVRRILKVLNKAQVAIDKEELEKSFSKELLKKDDAGRVVAKTVDNDYRKILTDAKNTYYSLENTKTATEHNTALQVVEMQINAEEKDAQDRISDAVNDGRTPSIADVFKVHVTVPLQRDIHSAHDTLELMWGADYLAKDYERQLADLRSTKDFKDAQARRNFGKPITPEDRVLFDKENELKAKMYNAQDAYLQYQRLYSNKLYNINKRVKQYLDEGNESLRDWLEKRAEEKKEPLKEAFADFKGDKVHVPFDTSKKKVARIVSGEKEAYIELADDLSSPLRSMHYMLNNVRNAFSGEGKLFERFFLNPETSIVAAEGRRADGVKEFVSNLDKKCKELFGKPFEDIASESQNPLDKDFKIVVSATLAEDLNNNKHDGRTDWKEGDLYTVDKKRIDKGHALYLWLTWRQADGRMKLEHEGFTQQNIDVIEKALGDRYKKFGEWMTDEFLPKMTDEKYNARYEELYGTSIDKTEHYFPLKIDRDALQQKGSIDDAGTTTVAMSNSVSPLIKRTRNNLKIDEKASAFDIVLRYGEQMEKWYNYAKIIEQMNSLYASNKLKNYLESYHHGYYKQLMDSFKVAVGADSFGDRSETDVLSRMNSRWGKGRIAFRQYTGIKQLASFPAFWTYSADLRYLSELHMNMLPGVNKMARDWCYKNLSLYRLRVDSGDMGYEGMHDTMPTQKYVRKFENAGMFTNRYFDRYAVAAGAKAVYDQFMRSSSTKDKIKSGEWTKEEAQDRARLMAEITFNKSQQSSLGMFSSKVQKDKSSLVRQLMLFRNSPIGYGRNYLTGLKDARKAIFGVSNANGTNVDFGSGWHRVKRGLGGFAAVVNYAFALTAAWSATSVATSFYDSDDSDPKYKDDIIKSVMLGLLTDWTIVGSPVSSAMGGNDYDSMPALTALTDIIKSFDPDDDAKLWEAVIDHVTSMGFGVNIRTWENIIEGIVGIYGDLSRNDGLPADAVMDFVSLINLPDSQRKDLARKLYAKYGPVKYAEIYQKVTDRILDFEEKKEQDSKRAKEWISGKNMKFYKDMEDNIGPLYEELKAEGDFIYPEDNSNGEFQNEVEEFKNRKNEIREDPRFEDIDLYARYLDLVKSISSSPLKLAEKRPNDAKEQEAELVKQAEKLISEWEERNKKRAGKQNDNDDK